ncbi:MAG TPA: polysaccharide deacetylase family protein [Thermoguttaceae bacterium]|nr:polysaccharide deacetylase family protein [Thermoguttaceae bacterium]
MISLSNPPRRADTSPLESQRPSTTSHGGPPPPRLPALRRVLGELYYYATYSGRSWYLRRLAAAGRAPIAVLTFHRIADDRANRWTMRTRDFVHAIRWLNRRFEMISLAELQHRMRGGFNSQAAVCITFDDGYAENGRVALPLLVELRVPCTYFVTTDAVLEQKPFVHDAVMGNYHFAPNTAAQLRHWRRAGIEIGAHTRTHANLGALTDRRRLVDEIVTSRVELESALGEPVRYFAFPFGSPENLSREAFDVALEAGYAGACSAYGRWNYPGDNPFHIRRRCVDGPPNRAKNWAMIDPIREGSLPDFVYRDEGTHWPQGPRRSTVDQPISRI